MKIVTAKEKKKFNLSCDGCDREEKRILNIELFDEIVIRFGKHA